MIKHRCIIEMSTTLSKRNHNKAANAAFRAAMRHHIEETLPRHFQENVDTAPGGGYGYEARSMRYERTKMRRFGHKRPMVLTGKLERLVYSQRVSAVTATFKGAGARIRSHFPMKKQRRREMEVITREERQAITQRVRDNYIAESAKYPHKKQKIIT